MPCSLRSLFLAYSRQIHPSPSQRIPTQTIFNETLIISDMALGSISSTAIRLSDLSIPHSVASMASATVASWMGEVDGAFVTWLAGRGDSAPAGGTSTMAAGCGPDFFGFQRHANVRPPGWRTRLGGIVAPVAALPGTMIYRFANFDPVGTFSDAMADFARESASFSPIATTSPGHPSHRTGGSPARSSASMRSLPRAGMSIALPHARRKNKRHPTRVPRTCGLVCRTGCDRCEAAARCPWSRTDAPTPQWGKPCRLCTGHSEVQGCRKLNRAGRIQGGATTISLVTTDISGPSLCPGVDI